MLATRRNFFCITPIQEVPNAWTKERMGPKLTDSFSLIQQKRHTVLGTRLVCLLGCQLPVGFHWLHTCRTIMQEVLLHAFVLHTILFVLFHGIDSMKRLILFCACCAAGIPSRPRVL